MLTILVVDDTSSVRDLICDYLSKGGYKVIKANNGKEALEQAVNKQPDIIITDIVMPEMNGFELCRSIKKNPITQNSRIVFCSSKTQKIDQLWGIKQGADIYITKPFTEKDLIEAVQSVAI